MTNHSEYKKTTCRYCNTKLEAPFLDLGSSPLANNLPKADEMIEEFKCPLALVKCSKCHLVQLSHVVSPDLMFSHYLYVSSTTKTFQEHFAEYANDLKERLVQKNSPLAVDIGSNDGLLLSCYQKSGMRSVGVEPAKNLSDEANQKGFITINRYFGEDAVNEIVTKFGKASVISANNVFAHIDDVQSVLRNVNCLLDENGIFVIEFPYLLTMFEKMFFDMIYHEHLSYIAITPLDFFTRQFDFQIFDIKTVTSHGGSLRVFIQKKNGPYKISKTVGQFLNNEKSFGIENEAPYFEFSKHVAQIKADILKFISKIKQEGKLIAGYGAPAKATTIVNYCGLNETQINFVVDDNPLKQNRLVPGTRIPIVGSAHLEKIKPDYILIFAWNFAEEIMKKTEFSLYNSRFIVPLPVPRIA